MEAYIRRNESLLIYSGMATIVFGFWNIAKVFMLRFMDPKKMIKFMNIDMEIDETLLLNIGFGVVLFFLILGMGIRLFVGLRAIEEGRGKKRSISYIVLAVIQVCAGLYSAMSNLLNYHEWIDYTEQFTTVILEITSCFAYFGIIIAAIRLRRCASNNNVKMVD